MATDEAFNLELCNKEVDKVDELFYSLKAKQITTTDEVDKELQDAVPQLRLFRQMELLWKFLNCDIRFGRLDQDFKDEVLEMVTAQVLVEKNVPHHMELNGSNWNVDPAFRPHYWSCLRNSYGDKVFQHLWTRTPNIDNLDVDSLFWIIHFAIHKNYQSILQTLWDHPSRSLIQVDQILHLLKITTPKVDNTDCLAYILIQLEDPLFTEVFRRDESLVESILSKANQEDLSAKLISIFHSKANSIRFMKDKLEALKAQSDIGQDNIDQLEVNLKRLVDQNELSENELLAFKMGQTCGIAKDVSTDIKAFSIARKVFEATDKVYPSNKKLGYLLLINIKDIAKKPEKERRGSEKDVDNVKKAFRGLGFQLYENKVHVNLTEKEMQDIIAKFAVDKCHQDVDCSAVVIMAHGGRGGLIYGYNNLPISVSKDILEHFANDKAEHLRGKPKLFFFQACRGADLASEIPGASFDDASSLDDDSSMHRLKFSEILQVFPTISEYRAVRANINGSWFIQALTRVLSNKENTNVMEIRELLDTTALELSKFKGDVVTLNGVVKKNVVQTMEYTVTGMSKKFYFPLR